MLTFMNEIFAAFRGCFSRTAAFSWFVTIVTGLMVRSDRLGITSVIRDLGLSPRLYETMLHFFRSTSWSLEHLRQTWYKVVQQNAPVYREQGYTILIGDGVKQSKEARFMPGVKKMFQESEDSSKPQYIYMVICLADWVSLIGNEAKNCYTYL